MTSRGVAQLFWRTFSGGAPGVHGWLFKAWLGMSLAFGPGCSSPRTEFKTDLSAPGWRVREGQAVWRPAKSELELAGELLAAVHPSGQSFVQFAKPPFQLVTAHRSGTQWQITFGATGRTFAGRGTPPRRFLWLFLGSSLDSGTPPPGWLFQAEAGGRWRFENPATGETLEGYLRSRPKTSVPMPLSRPLSRPLSTMGCFDKGCDKGPDKDARTRGFCDRLS
jgi:hypothetical protein